jgi:hypothetical protein
MSPDLAEEPAHQQPADPVALVRGQDRDVASPSGPPLGLVSEREEMDLTAEGPPDGLDDLARPAVAVYEDWSSIQPPVPESW